MYEKKNELSQQAPVLDEISVRLLDDVHGNLDLWWYRTLSLLSRIYPANSTIRVLFSSV